MISGNKLLSSFSMSAIYSFDPGVWLREFGATHFWHFATLVWAATHTLGNTGLGSAAKLALNNFAKAWRVAIAFGFENFCLTLIQSLLIFRLDTFYCCFLQ